MVNRMKILYTTPVIFYPPLSGSHLRIKNSVKALSKISNLYLYSRVSYLDMGGEESFRYFKKYCKKIYFPPFGNLAPRNYVNFIFRKIFNNNIYSPRSEARMIYKDILKKADEIKADVIWLGFGNLSYPLLKFIKQNSRYKVVLDTDSVWSRFILRALPFVSDKKKKNRIKKDGQAKEIEEKRGTKLSDITTAVSPLDANYYRDLVANKEKIRIKIFPNVIDLDDYKNLSLESKVLKKPAVVMTGTFWKGSPMEDAAKWFLSEIWPIVIEKIPIANLYIIGKGSKLIKSKKEKNIFVLGKVDLVAPFLAHSDLMVVPLRFESGTRFKILEAAACGLPVVSTKLGAEGLEVTDNKNIIIFDDPKFFARSVVELIDNCEKAKLLSKQLNELVRTKYTIKILSEHGREILDYLVG